MFWMMRSWFSEECQKRCTVTRKGIATGRIDEEKSERADRLRLVWRFLKEKFQ
jgi:hypothetical protein